MLLLNQTTTLISLEQMWKRDVVKWIPANHRDEVLKDIGTFPFKFGIVDAHKSEDARCPKGKYIVAGMTPLFFAYVRVKDINTEKLRNWGRVKRDAKNIAVVQTSIEKGEYEPYHYLPPVIDKDGNLIAGWHRWDAHYLEKQEYMWCLVCDFESEDVKEEYNQHENVMCESFSKVETKTEDNAQLAWKAMTTIVKKTGKPKLNPSKSAVIKWCRERGISNQQKVASLTMELYTSGKGVVPMVTYTEGELKKIYKEYFGEQYKVKDGQSQSSSIGSIMTINAKQEPWEQRRLIHALQRSTDGSPKNLLLQFSNLNSSQDLEKVQERYFSFTTWLKEWAKGYANADFSNVRTTVINPLNREGELIER